MKSEALEIQIEDWNGNTVLFLRGRFNNEQIPNIREKISDLLAGGDRSFIIDLTYVSEPDNAVPEFFLEVLNTVRGKQGELRIVYGRDEILSLLQKFRNVLELYPERKDLFSGGLMRRLQTRGIVLSRKTGMRISRPVAVLLLFALTGWILFLLTMLLIQNHQVARQKKELADLTEWRTKTLQQIQILQERLKPLEDLGIVTDSLPKP